MDYIREELLRQQRALAALMTGQEAAEDARTAALEPEGAGPETGAAGAPAQGGRRTSPAAARADAAVWREAEDMRAAGAALKTADAAAGAGGAAAERRRDAPEGTGETLGPRGRSTGAAALWARGGRTGTPESAARAGAAFGDGDAPASGAAGPWTAGVSGGGVSAGARVLSLAFQRDARRYDGGFPLY